jgi:hypothetical protein
LGGKNKKMKSKSNKIFVYAVIPVLAGAMFFGANAVYARGFFGGFDTNLTDDEMASRHEKMFQEQANILGISADDIKTGWAQGKNLKDIAKDKGITEDQLKQKMNDARIAQMKMQIQTLVTKGVITQTQADQRLNYMQTAIGKGGGKMRMGRHNRLGF